LAKEWTVNETILLIQARLARVAPDNVAQIPFAIAFEDGQWHVDIMVKRPHVEYDVHAQGEDLTQAMKGAYKRLGNWQMLERSQLS
jgi:hypothetical protein